MCLLLQDLGPSCWRGGRGILEDMLCYERRRAEDLSERAVCVYYCSTYYKAVRVCVGGGNNGGHVYERLRAEACVD